MKWGVALNVAEPVNQTVESARRLEMAGIEQIWITDYPSDRYAPAVAAAVAQATSLCKIGVGLVSPYLYSPDTIARFMMTLIQAYGPRFLLLVGPGDRYALERVGISLPRGPSIVKEIKHAALEVKKQLNAHGLECPVFLGAQGPKMMTASLELDGVLLNYSDLEHALWTMRHFKNRDREFVMGLFPPTHLSPTAKPGDNSILHAAAIVALGLTRELQKEFGVRNELEPVRKKLASQGTITSEMIDQMDVSTLSRFGLSLTGPELCEYMNEAANLGFDQVVLGPPLCMDKANIDYLIDTRRNCTT